MNEHYIIYSTSKASSVMHEAEENNVLLLQVSDENEESLAAAATTLSLPSPSTDNPASENLSQRSVKMKFY